MPGASDTTRKHAIKRLRDAGKYIWQSVETYNPHTRRSSDLFHCIDLVAISSAPPTLPGVLGIQTTSASALAAHVRKATEDPTVVHLLHLWLQAGNRYEIWGWSSRGPAGKRKLILSTDRTIRIADPLIPTFHILEQSELGTMTHPASSPPRKKSRKGT